VTYQAVTIGDLPVDFESVISKDVGNAVTSMTLRNLKPLVVYRITVAAISNKGPGPAGVTFGGQSNLKNYGKVLAVTKIWCNVPKDMVESAHEPSGPSGRRLSRFL